MALREGKTSHSQRRPETRETAFRVFQLLPLSFLLPVTTTTTHGHRVPTELCPTGPVVFCSSAPHSLPLEEIQRKSRVREWIPKNAPRIRAGVTKKDQKAELKKNQTRRCYAGKTSSFFPGDRQTPARREARNHRSEDAKMLGPPPCRPQRTGRADQRDARGDANRDRSTQNHRRPVLLCATQRPRSTNNETTTTTRHRELRDPRPTHLTVDLGDWGLR